MVWARNAFCSHFIVWKFPRGHGPLFRLYQVSILSKRNIFLKKEETYPFSHMYNVSCALLYVSQFLSGVPTSRAYHSSAYHGDRVFVLGGAFQDAQVCVVLCKSVLALLML